MDNEQRGSRTVQAEPGDKDRASARPADSNPVTNGPPHTVELHIEELVLHGFAPRDRYSLADAVERTLVRLFAERGVPPSLINGVEVARLDAGAFRLAGDSGADAVGARIAEALYGGLNQ